MPTRKEVLKFLTNCYKFSALMPQQKKCNLPSIGLEINVPVHPFLGCLYSLLTSPELMKSDLLIFKNLDNLSYVPPLDSYECYDEIDSGTAYHLFQQKIATKENAVQILLIFFSDGTVVDKAGQHSFEPFMFTLGIFKQILRTKPMAWQNLGFTKSNPKSKFSNAEKERGKQNVLKYRPKDPRFVPDNHRDFHAQVRIILQELLTIQELQNGLEWQFTIDGVKQGKIYHLYFPILFFMGDTVEHNKLCSLHGGPRATYVCRICNCPSQKLDEPCVAMTLEEKRQKKRKGERIYPNTFVLTDAKKIKIDRVTWPEKVVEKGYYPCLENIFYDLTFCDPLGINISTPPEALHAILLGHGTRLLNAFARLEQEKKDTKKKQNKEKDEDEESGEEDEDEKKKRRKRKERIMFLLEIFTIK
jgi:hypothetical protein